MIKTFFTGGCICGAIRYECSAQLEEIKMLKCHCRDCQRISGGPYSPVVYVPAKTFKITKGTPRYYATPSESHGENRRSFCPDCGSRLTGGERPGTNGIGLMASSLDDPSGFKAQIEIWMSDAQPWDLIDPAGPKFEKVPPH